MNKAELEELLATVERSGGSALHLIAGRKPCLRIQGNLVDAEVEPLSPQVIVDLTRDFLFADHRERLADGDEVDVLYTTASGVRYRTSVASTTDGLNVVFRRVPETVPTFEELNLPDVLDDLIGLPGGLVLVTGFLGSGKTTTLAALIDRLNRETAQHIVSLESPIEFIHEPSTALLHQREVGTHVASIATGVRDAWQSAADVVFVGDIHTAEDVFAVLDSAERGCLVVASLHASSAIGAIDELVRLVPIDDRESVRRRLAVVLRGLVSQQLLRRRHGKGRIPLFEVVVKNSSVESAIADGRFDDLPEIMWRGRGLGMQTVDYALRELLAHNLITVEEAAYHAVDREWLRGSGRLPVGV